MKKIILSCCSVIFFLNAYSIKETFLLIAEHPETEIWVTSDKMADLQYIGNGRVTYEIKNKDENFKVCQKRTGYLPEVEWIGGYLVNGGGSKPFEYTLTTMQKIADSTWLDVRLVFDKVTKAEKRTGSTTMFMSLDTDQLKKEIEANYVARGLITLPEKEVSVKYNELTIDLEVTTVNTYDNGQGYTATINLYVEDAMHREIVDTTLSDSSYLLPPMGNVSQKQEWYFAQNIEVIVATLFSKSRFTDRFNQDLIHYEELRNGWSDLPLSDVTSAVTLGESSKACVTVESGNRHGSGFVIDPSGFLITNMALLGEKDTVSVTFYDGSKSRAVMRRFSPETLVVVLESVEKIPAGIKPISLAITEWEVGQPVAVIGTPGDLELGQSVSKGIISGKRKIDGRELIQTDASLGIGSIGGPMLSEDGHLLGIISTKAIGLGVEGLGFAAPLSQTLLDQLRISVR